MKYIFQRYLLVLIITLLSSNLLFSQKQMKTYHDYARTIVKESYIVNANGQKNGICKLFTRDGIKEAEINYKNGVIDGQVKTYYLIVDVNRKDYLKQLGTYKNNKPVTIIDYKFYLNGKECNTDEDFQQGTCTKFKEVFYKAGAIDREINYGINGNVIIDFSDNGIFLMNYDNGKPYVNANKLNGKFNGPYVMYNTNGIIIQKGTYKDNVTIGEWILPRDEDGLYPDKNLDNPAYLRKVTFKNEGIDDKYSFNKKADLDKEIITVSYYLNGVKRDSCNLSKCDNYGETIGPGDYFSYYENGQLESKGKIYKNSQENYPKWETDCLGLWIHYYENGKIKSEGTYIENPGKDPREGQIWKYYKEDGTLDEEKIW